MAQGAPRAGAATAGRWPPPQRAPRVLRVRLLSDKRGGGDDGDGICRLPLVQRILGLLLGLAARRPRGVNGALERRWRCAMALEQRAASDHGERPAQPDAAQSTSGPIRVPRTRPTGLALLGWVITAFVLLVAVLIYAGTHANRGPAALQAAPPTWGTLTLSGIALRAARQAGDAHPTAALWVATARMRAVPYLTGRPDSNAEADFLVSMAGSFHAATVPAALPGSLSAGKRLVILVRGFDGRVTGRFITNRRLSTLRQLGIVHTLALGFHL